MLVKTVVPRRRPDVVRRERLIQRLEQWCQEDALVLVTAPAGFGKTTLLVDLAYTVPARVVWYSAREEDSDQVALVDGLVAATELHFPKSLAGARRQLRAAWREPQSVESAVRALADALAEMHERIVFIIDDAHHLGASREAIGVLDVLLDHHPGNVVLVLSSRVGLPLRAAPRLKANRLAHTMDQVDLAMTRDELLSLLTRARGAPADAEVDRVWALTQGWPAAAVLLSASIWEGATARSIEARGASGELFAYLASEVLDGCDGRVRSFLLGASILDGFTADLCDALLGISDSAQICQELEERYGLMTTTALADHTVVHRFHALFQDFLCEAARAEDPDNYRRLQRRAGDLLRSSSTERALTHYLAAGAEGEACSCLLEAADGMVRGGHGRDLERLMDLLPPASVQGVPELLFWRAEAQRSSGNVIGALGTAEAAVGLCGGQYSEVRARALLVRGACLRRMGDYEEAMNAFASALEVAQVGELSDTVVADAWHHVAIAFQLQGRFQDSVSAVEEALTRYPASDQYRRGLALWDLGLARLRLGQLDRAHADFERARRCLRLSDHKAGVAGVLVNLGALSRISGAYDVARDRLRQALELSREAEDSRIQAACYKTLADVAYDLGDYERSRGEYGEALLLAEQASDESLAAESLAGLAESLAAGGAKGEAEHLLRQGLVTARQNSPYMEGLYLAVLGAIQDPQDALGESVKLLERACELLEACAALRYAAVARFRLAGRHFYGGKYSLVAAQLEIVAKHCSAIGTAAFLAPEARRSALVLQYAASRRLAKGFYTKLLSLVRSSSAGAEAQHSFGALSVDAYALGQVRLLINGQQIAFSAWRSRKTRELFFYLLMHPGWQHRDSIVVDLWPDISPEQATGILHTTLYRLRRATHPGLLVRQDHSYRINPACRVRVDVLAFEQYIEQAEQSMAARREFVSSLEAALEVYKGEFLPDCYSEWCEGIRRRLDGMLRRALERVAAHYEAQGMWEAAYPYWERLANESPYEEDVQLELVGVLRHLGRSSDAERRFRDYVDRLKREGLWTSEARLMRRFEAIMRGAPAA